MKTAHYFKTSKVQYVVISDSNRPVGERHEVQSKTEARKLAKSHSAKPWNF